MGREPKKNNKNKSWRFTYWLQCTGRLDVGITPCRGGLASLPACVQSRFASTLDKNRSRFYYAQLVAFTQLAENKKLIWKLSLFLLITQYFSSSDESLQILRPSSRTAWNCWKLGRFALRVHDWLKGFPPWPNDMPSLEVNLWIESVQFWEFYVLCFVGRFSRKSI